MTRDKTNPASKSVLHVTAVRNLTAGQRQQLAAEVSAVKRLGLDWETVAIHNGVVVHKFERNFSRLFRGLFLRNLYCWIYMLRRKGDYDYILQRHMTFDPFALFFSWFIPNRVTVHHSKELYELKLVRSGWKGSLVSVLECVTGKVSAMNARAIVGVTPEIAAYECQIHNVKKKALFYPNGIDLRDVPLLQDDRHPLDLNIAFVCGKFSSWHGLDLLLDAAREADKNFLGVRVFIHLIGNLSPPQQRMVASFDNGIVFIDHGHMAKEDYLSVLSKCDVALGSLALFRKNISDATTLKVREYLAMGLPVIASSHHDSALPIKFKYFHSVDMKDLFAKAVEVKRLGFDRAQVREAASVYVEKEIWMKGLIAELYHI